MRFSLLIFVTFRLVKNDENFVRMKIFDTHKLIIQFERENNFDF